jgi:hypothetical protein
MARPATNIAMVNVIQALRIEGYDLAEARKLVELAKAVSELEPKQQLIRARDLDANHVGMLIEYPGRSGFLNDIEATSRTGSVRDLKTAYHAQNLSVDYEDDGTGILHPRARGPYITTVIDSKIVRIPFGMMVKLTETRDL